MGTGASNGTSGEGRVRRMTVPIRRPSKITPMSFVASGLIPCADLFSGAGGLSLGLTEAGFEVTMAADWDEDACDSFSKHHPLTEVIRGDLGARDSLDRVRSYRGLVRVVAGGPPCQPRSTGGLRKGAEDPRNGFPLFARAIEILEPEAFVMDMASGTIRAQRRPYFDQVVKDLEALSYEVVSQELNAADWGVPQEARRVIAVGIRGKAFQFPDPTHGPTRPAPHVAAGAVLSIDRIIGEPNPCQVTYASNPDPRGSAYDCLLFTGKGRPIDLTRPSPTLVASMSGNNIPWVDTESVALEYHDHLIKGGKARSGLVQGARRITVLEAGALQSFPVEEISGAPTVSFTGPRSSQYRQVASAVPPELGKAIGVALREQLG